MTITGFSNNYYLINNPIWVTVADPAADNILVSVQFPDGSGHLFNFVMFDHVVKIDIAEIIKGMMPLVKADSSVEPLYATNAMATFTIMYFARQGELVVAPVQSYTKQFIRGGNFTGTNQHLQDGALLLETGVVPFWQNYPITQSSINSTAIVTYTTTTLIDPMKTVGCDPLYIAFRNTKGGFQYWLFELWAMSSKTGAQEALPDYTGFTSLGADNDHSIQVSGKVEKRHYPILRALAQSHEIYAYKLGDKINEATGVWTQLLNKGNSFKSESHKDIQEAMFKFDLPTSENPSQLW